MQNKSIELPYSGYAVTTICQSIHQQDLARTYIICELLASPQTPFPDRRVSPVNSQPSVGRGWSIMLSGTCKVLTSNTKPSKFCGPFIIFLSAQCLSVFMSLFLKSRKKASPLLEQHKHTWQTVHHRKFVSAFEPC